MSFLMVMVDFPLCSPPISGGRCILLVHFQLPAMLLNFAISGGGLAGGMADGDPMANAKAASEAMSFIRSCLQLCMAIVLFVKKVTLTQNTNWRCNARPSGKSVDPNEHELVVEVGLDGAGDTPRADGVLEQVEAVVFQQHPFATRRAHELARPLGRIGNADLFHGVPRVEGLSLPVHLEGGD